MALQEMNASTGRPNRWLEGMIRSSLRGLFTHRVVRSSLEAAPQTDQFRIVDELLTSQAAGDFAFKKRRWVVSTKETKEAEFDRSSNVDSEEHAHKGLLPGIPCDVLQGTYRFSDIEIKNLGEDRADFTPDWQFFRGLAGHYRECLHLGGASRCNHNAERHATQFHILNARTRWWPDDAGGRPIRIARSDLGGPFLAALANRPQEPVLLGYPLSVSFLPEDVRLIAPCCILQCRWSLDDVAMTVSPISEVPILNQDWVKQNHARRAFKSALRKLADLAVEDERELSLAGAESWSNVTGLINTLSDFLPNMIDRRLDPSQLDRHLNLDRRDVLQNTLGLFLVSDNPYTKGCRADLAKIANASNEDLLERERSSEPD